MTKAKTLSTSKRVASSMTTAVCIGLSVLLLTFSDVIRKSIYDGLVFSFTTVIPTLFPFFVLSDLWAYGLNFDDRGRPGRAFSYLFGISGCALSAALCGMVCGFPLGVKLAMELYNQKRIGRGEAERLCGFANNPSAAFVISGVGCGIIGSLKIGILLYFSVILSAIMVGVIFRRQEDASQKFKDISQQSFNLPTSIGSAGLASVNVTACICFFSAVIGLISHITKNDVASALISPFFEVTCSVKMIGESSLFSHRIGLPFIAFALGFSGFSVHMQAFTFFPPEISKGKYLLMKLIQGIFAFFTMLLLSPFSK